MMTLRDKMIFTLGFVALVVTAVGAFIGIYGNVELGMLISVSSLLFMPIVSLVDLFFEEKERGRDE